MDGSQEATDPYIHCTFVCIKVEIARKTRIYGTEGTLWQKTCASAYELLFAHSVLTVLTEGAKMKQSIHHFRLIYYLRSKYP